MRARIYDSRSSDVADLTTWRSGGADKFYVPIELAIGPEGEKGSDLFQIVVASRQAIQNRQGRRSCKLLVVDTFDWTTIHAILESWVAECEGHDWPELVSCLRNHFDWEFDRYHS